MRRSIVLASVIVSAITALAACQPTETTKPSTPVNSASPITSPSQAPAGSPASSPATDGKATVGKADTLVGQWPGVEGTYLKVDKKGEKYEIEIKNLDGSKKYEGTAKGDVIEFTRNGKTETIKAATAEETGMKWLKGEKNCVVITKGSEGYCKN
jgi:hypothetical protein